MAKDVHFDTKTKILTVARELFAQKGYVGTSIRDIAREAQVNVASVNYHFKNKNELYSLVYSETHIWLEELVRDTCQSSDSFLSAVVGLFTQLQRNGYYLNNTFRMFLSNEIPEGVEEMCQTKEPITGPPGHQYLEELLVKELKEEVPSRKIKSLVNSTYALVIHWSLVCSTECYERYYANLEGYTIEDKVSTLKLHCEAMIEKLNRQF